jgi:peptide/nickel transport system permease protein
MTAVLTTNGLAAREGEATRARPIGAPSAPVGVWVAGAVLAVLVLAAVAPGTFTSVDPLLTDPVHAFAAPGAGHWFGTDQLGRDQLSRVVHGARASLSVGLGATAIAVVLGSLLGVSAGLARGRADRALARLLDVLFAFPEMLFALIVVTVLGVGGVNVLVAIGIGAVPGYARVLRGQVRLARGSGYAEAAVGLGLHPVAVAWRHVLPNAVGPVLVLATMGVGSAITFGAGLSFIGLGVQPPDPEWGLMLSESRAHLARAPWLGLFPGLVLTATVVCCTVVGRHLQHRHLVPGRAS